MNKSKTGTESISKINDFGMGISKRRDPGLFALSRFAMFIIISVILFPILYSLILVEELIVVLHQSQF